MQIGLSRHWPLSKMQHNRSLELRWEFIKENKKIQFRPRKRSTKIERKHALDQEADQEKKKKKHNGQEIKKVNTLSTKKTRKNFFFRDRFLGRERVFFLFFLLCCFHL